MFVTFAALVNITASKLWQPLKAPSLSGWPTNLEIRYEKDMETGEGAATLVDYPVYSELKSGGVYTTSKPVMLMVVSFDTDPSPSPPLTDAGRIYS